jgi:hypothetical protein
MEGVSLLEILIWGKLSAQINLFKLLMAAIKLFFATSLNSTSSISGVK